MLGSDCTGTYNMQSWGKTCIVCQNTKPGPAYIYFKIWCLCRDLTGHENYLVWKWLIWRSVQTIKSGIRVAVRSSSFAKHRSWFHLIKPVKLNMCMLSLGIPVMVSHPRAVVSLNKHNLTNNEFQ